MSYRQADPYSIQIEPTEGCNLRCGFCGIRGIREKGTTGQLSGPFKFMTVATADSIARQIARAGWRSRIEFAMHGEPTLNPDLPGLVSAFRSRLPRNSVMLTTNGIPLIDGPWGSGDLRGALVELMNAGVATIAVDDYAPHRVAPKIRRLSLPFPVLEYPRDRAGNPHARYTGQRVVIVEDIAQASTGTHSTLNNHAGSAAPKDRRRNAEPCTLPFRELSIRWNGQIALCCNDWRGEYRVGDARDVVGAWHSHEMYAARRLLLAEGRADVKPCDGCDFRGTRVGLLPDPAGRQKEALGPPTEEDRVWAVAATEHGTLTPVVLQRYERASARAAGLRLVAGGSA